MIELVDIRINQNTRQKIDELLSQGRLSSGKTNYEFEDALAKLCGVTDTISCVNGTIALQIIWQALGVSSGAKILTTPFTFIASSNSILYQRAVPIFADIQPDTFNLDPNMVEDELKKDSSIRYVLLVNLYGLMCDVPAFEFLKNKYELTIIEDCAQSHGSAYYNRQSGSIFDAASFSFYATKNAYSGEGGACIFKDKNQLELARKISNHGRSSSYEHDVLGNNYRMSEIHAMIGLSSLGELKKQNNSRIKNAEYLSKNLPVNVVPPCCPENYTHVYHQYVIRTPYRNQLQEFLLQQGIKSNVVYPVPNYRQKIYLETFSNFKDFSLPNTEKACDEVLSLPVHPFLTESDLKHVSDSVKSFFNSRE